MKAVAVIPARFASTRLPGKPLLKDTGRYLIQHVYDQVSRASRVADVIVATDDERILDAVHSFGGRAELTRSDHPSGTDRVAEVASRTPADIIINVQGDEPEIEPNSIDRLVEMLAGGEVGIATLACPFAKGANPSDPNSVKVVIDRRGRAMYFSRSLIPYPREASGRVADPASFLLHIGIYGYQRETLLQLARLTPTPLEQSEKLEQLRFLENGFEIGVGVMTHGAIGIDTPEDYAAFVMRYQAIRG